MDKNDKLNELFNEATRLPSNWHRRELFAQFSCLSNNQEVAAKIKEHMDLLIRKHSLIEILHKDYGEKDTFTFLVANKTLGDRINFVVLGCAIAAMNNKQANFIVQDDALSDIFKSFSSLYVHSIHRYNLPENDFVLAMQDNMDAMPFLLNWWSFPFQNKKIIAKRKECKDEDWYEFIRGFKESLGKWDMLFQMYSVSRLPLENVYSFTFDQQSIMQLYERNGLRYGKSVLIAPVANTLPHSNLLIKILNKIVEKLKLEGYDCIENLKPGEETRLTLSGTKAVSIPPIQLASMIYYTRHIVAYRSGFCDLAYLVGCNLNVIYPYRPRGVETVFSGWGLSSSSTNVSEYFLDLHSESEITKNIVKKITSLEMK